MHSLFWKCWMPPFYDIWLAFNFLCLNIWMQSQNIRKYWMPPSFEIWSVLNYATIFEWYCKILNAVSQIHSVFCEFWMPPSLEPWSVLNCLCYNIWMQLQNICNCRMSPSFEIWSVFNYLRYYIWMQLQNTECIWQISNGNLEWKAREKMFAYSFTNNLFTGNSQFNI